MKSALYRSATKISSPAFLGSARLALEPGQTDRCSLIGLAGARQGDVGRSLRCRSLLRPMSTLIEAVRLRELSAADRDNGAH
ncbi:MAG: hypothetical protein ACTXOO_01670 [Sodalis sp. (in: enterobacteria)]